ncbi:MAG: hypothetical protein ACREE9_19410 [Stellaceae bacterium]
MSLSPPPSHATRRQISQGLAYRHCGKPDGAAAWAAKLVRMLEAEHILQPRFRNPAPIDAPRELPSR